ncbi:hypothetical protein BEP19_04585 [Ammoniphilus oxalaticus]|uniref:Membrane protein FxsA n=1 Tax=Ammoniphilus oxalaticus TaxID=66863 RepID=A0A419SM09_9BACL|nr:FxsA family protein [Ammoniphilus oxalaticus]RKD25101.1 hypothetical protein BEP19_04585 [Ammoniphilus oxalaticus]
MLRIIIALLLIVPTIEIWLLITAGKAFGWLPTLLTIILTGVVGGWLARKQGLQVFYSAQRQMRQGQLPGEALLDGLIIFTGGLLLLSPGFFTDTLGILCLIPMIRGPIKIYLKGWLWKTMQNGRISFRRGGPWR